MIIIPTFCLYKIEFRNNNHLCFAFIFSEPDPPTSMIQLHEITDKPTGWIQLVKSLVRVVPIEHPMGPSVITLLLDDSPLPTKDSVLEVADMITHSLRRTPRKERNLCVILGCLAEKLAGPSSVAVLSETTLGYLLGNLVSSFSLYEYRLTLSTYLSNNDLHFMQFFTRSDLVAYLF